MTTEPGGVEPSKRPDFVFKLLTKLQAVELGLEVRDTEQQPPYNTLGDLTLAVPAQVQIAGTMFDFFRSLNVIEFKSEGIDLPFVSLSKTRYVPTFNSFRANTRITATS